LGKLDRRLKLSTGTIPNVAGRPNLDVIVMLKSLFIQQLYSLSDEQLEREIADSISFRVFLGTTTVVPDSTTLKLIRILVNTLKI